MKKQNEIIKPPEIYVKEHDMDRAVIVKGTIEDQRHLL